MATLFFSFETGVARHKSISGVRACVSIVLSMKDAIVGTISKRRDLKEGERERGRERE